MYHALEHQDEWTNVTYFLYCYSTWEVFLQWIQEVVQLVNNDPAKETKSLFSKKKSDDAEDEEFDNDEARSCRCPQLTCIQIITYLADKWNWADGVRITLNVIVNYALFTNAKWSYLQQIIALNICFTILKVFDWMKLFDNTSFFVMLIAEIFKDIKYFVILLLLTILTFGAPLVFL